MQRGGQQGGTSAARPSAKVLHRCCRCAGLRRTSEKAADYREMQPPDRDPLPVPSASIEPRARPTHRDPPSAGASVDAARTASGWTRCWRCGARVLAQPPAGPGRGRPRAAWTASVCTHNASRRCGGQAVEVDLVPTAESLAFRPQAMALGAVRGRARAGARQAGRPGGAPGAGNWRAPCSTACWRAMRARALPRAGIVHRLDKDTSGVMVVGKTLEAVTALVRDIAAREVQRSTWPSPGARSNRARSASTRRSGATRRSACAWPWWPAAGRRAPTSSAWPGA
jgi:hypothetical protein